VEELTSLGVQDVCFDDYGYVYGYLPGNVQNKNTIGFIAHMDTATETSGKDIHPTIIHNYDGKTIVINEKKNLTLSPKDFPHLNQQKNHTLIVTDGTTLLGADDKAGIAIIFTALETWLSNPALPHPGIVVTITPDEEVGRGTEHFNYAYYQEKNCSMAYTLDGGDPNIIEFENFNAASAQITITGKTIHPGSAKGKMVNSLLIAMEVNAMLPQNMKPSLTENHEGFYHLIEMNGSCGETRMHYLIRNHDKKEFAWQKEFFTQITDFINQKYGSDTMKSIVKDSYYNMKELILTKPILLENAVKAEKRVGLNPSFEPIRGGTDGASLTFKGIYTPNLGTGGANYHGPQEYLDVFEAESMVKVLLELGKIYTE
jgi:tripeptide aminopeptidase